MKKLLLLLISVEASMILMGTSLKISDSGFPGKSFSPGEKPDTVISNLPISVDAFHLEIIPPSSGVQFYKEGLVFLGSTKSESKMVWDHLSFGNIDARYGNIKDTLLSDITLFSPSSVFNYPCEALTFSSDYNTMYLTRYSKKDGSEKIYQAKFTPGGSKGGSWSIDENPVDFCSDNAVYSHPALSDDGKIMIFSSNRSGSLGGFDLFVSQNKGGKWSDPVNLGDAVNTKGDELYPFLDSENNLFFSSDGLMGYGGLDVFVCRFKGNTWERPVNLGLPVNTINDDVAFTLNRKSGKSGFYTIKQGAGKKSVQLYKISLNKYTGNGTFSTLSQYFTNPSITNVAVIVTEPAVQATDRKQETAKAPEPGKGNVIYRVQFMTSFNPKTRSQLGVNGKNYNVFEYLYSGAYRLCIGEFNSYQSAKDLQTILVRDEYPRATVVAFINNVISNDPELYKETKTNTASQLTQEKPAVTEQTPPVKQAETKTIPVVADNTKPVVKTEEAVKKEPVKTEPQQPVTAVKTETAKPAATETEVKKDVIIYRVQIVTNSTKKGSYKLTLESRTYDTYEYLYQGTYKTCVGEYTTLTPAKDLQNICRRSGYPQAFVVVFKNNVRTNDPALFR
jgi:hypothetical protein